MARQGRAAAAGQQPEAVIQPRQKCAGGSTRTRAAASSIARGMPSSRAADLRPPPARCWSITAKRRQHRAGAVDEQPHRSDCAAAAGAAAPGREERRHPRAVSPATPSGSRLVARTRTIGQARGAARRPGARRRAGARSCRGSAAGAWAQGVGQRGRQRPDRVLPQPTAAATAWGTSAGSASGASSTSQTPRGTPASASAADLQGQAGLARPAGAGEGHQPVRAQQP